MGRISFLIFHIQPLSFKQNEVDIVAQAAVAGPMPKSEFARTNTKIVS